MSSRPEAECGTDDVPKLENNVVYALSRLGKANSKSSGGRGKVSGVSTQEIVEFLTENYQYLDGDVESQVKTALLSCVKIGFVCAQDNGKFRLLGANPRMMTSNCLTRYDHGVKCSCVPLMNAVTKIKPHNCCILQASTKKVPKMMLKRTSAKNKANSTLQSLSKAPKKKSTPHRCIEKVARECRDSGDSHQQEGTSEPRSKKCSYCLKNHVKMTSGLKTCRKCYPRGMECAVPADKFSPREEVM